MFSAPGNRCTRSQQTVGARRGYSLAVGCVRYRLSFDLGRYGRASLKKGRSIIGMPFSLEGFAFTPSYFYRVFSMVGVALASHALAFGIGSIRQG